MGLKLGYTRRDINKMYYSFKKLDVYNTNKVEFASFCEVNRINNPLGEAIFYKILEIEKNGEITFESYLLCIWNAFSIFDNSSMAELAFQLFDTDKSGSLSFPEIGKMVALMYGDKSTKYHQVMSALGSYGGEFSRDITQNNFVKLTQGLPTLLFLIFEHLRIGKKNTLSLDRWDQIRKIRSIDLAKSTDIGKIKDFDRSKNDIRNTSTNRKHKRRTKSLDPAKLNMAINNTSLSPERPTTNNGQPKRKTKSLEPAKMNMAINNASLSLERPTTDRPTTSESTTKTRNSIERRSFDSALKTEQANSSPISSLELLNLSRSPESHRRHPNSGPEPLWYHHTAVKKRLSNASDISNETLSTVTKSRNNSESVVSGRNKVLEPLLVPVHAGVEGMPSSPPPGSSRSSSKKIVPVDDSNTKETILLASAMDMLNNASIDSRG
eukprot:CAMPEP_0119042630 /NCGR_PEP_ID=MMETSP1177-20130426/16034_1 /TAXON_ID=2985 /ORGANISM="Ochromonas sp, Strain CCMP1899" /LENGTH=437 /DNA_ID=CAMNT_0007009559 /DNA_START=351 /DNA_END=1664 /DNA_ORIENTATION=+